MVQYSNSAKTCHQSEKDGTILKQSQNLSPVRKRWYNTETVQKPVTSQKTCYHTQIEPKPVSSQKKIVQYSNGVKSRQQSKKRWCNSQTVVKPANSQKKMVQYSNRAKTCHQSEKDVKFSNSA